MWIVDLWQSDLDWPVPWQDPVEKELEHRDIAGFGELDRLAHEFACLAGQQSFGDPDGPVSRPGPSATIALGKRAPPQTAGSRWCAFLLRTHVLYRTTTDFEVH